MSSADRWADVLVNALEQRALPLAKATPRQVSTAVTPEQVDRVMAIRRTLAAFLIGDASLADIAELLAELLALGRQQALR